MSSSEEGRDDRRGPAGPEEKAAGEGVDAASGLAADAAGPEAPKEKPSEEDDQKDATKPAREASHKPGGARKNWHRKDGDDDTWTCPDCKRVIKNHPASKDQHRVSAYCFSHRLWNAHAFDDWSLCEKYGKEWAAGPDRYGMRSVVAGSTR